MKDLEEIWNYTEKENTVKKLLGELVSAYENAIRNAPKDAFAVEFPYYLITEISHLHLGFEVSDTIVQVIRCGIIEEGQKAGYDIRFRREWWYDCDFVCDRETANISKRKQIWKTN